MTAIRIIDSLNDIFDISPPAIPTWWSLVVKYQKDQQSELLTRDDVESFIEIVGAAIEKSVLKGTQRLFLQVRLNAFCKRHDLPTRYPHLV